MTNPRALALASIALSLFVSAASALAQGAPPLAPQAPSAPFGREMRHDGFGMGIVPPGTWWRNQQTVTALSLSADQQKKLDDIFLQNRIQLIHMHASLEEEQLKLEPLLNANPPDQTKSMAVISRIADLRADLEKADAKMLLSLRGVLTADQWTKLQTEGRNSMRDRMNRGDDRRGRQGPGGPGAPGGPDAPNAPGARNRRGPGNGAPAPAAGTPPPPPQAGIPQINPFDLPLSLPAAMLN